MRLSQSNFSYDFVITVTNDPVFYNERIRNNVITMTQFVILMINFTFETAHES